MEIRRITQLYLMAWFEKYRAKPEETGENRTSKD
jgi:hypothetical protein